VLAGAGWVVLDRLEPPQPQIIARLATPIASRRWLLLNRATLRSVEPDTGYAAAGWPQ
jgi:hypothetical protein